MCASSYILTNRHVVGSGPFWGFVVFDNHEEVDAFPVYRDPVHDFGILRFDPKALKYMSIQSLQLRPDLAKGMFLLSRYRFCVWCANPTAQSVSRSGSSVTMPEKNSVSSQASSVVWTATPPSMARATVTSTPATTKPTRLPVVVALAVPSSTLTGSPLPCRPAGAATARRQTTSCP